MFPKDHSEVVLMFIHILESGNVGVPGELDYDPCTQFQSFVENSNSVFGHHFVPYQQLSVDESLIGTKNHK
jgi:hypothetical protein